MPTEDKLTFEEALKQLNEIVNQLEESDVPLEKAIEVYKKGMDLSKFCHEKLNNIQEEIALIMKDNGELEAFSKTEGE